MLLSIIYLVIFEVAEQVIGGLHLEDVGPVLNFTETAAKHGYPSEEHKVVTNDGYILKIFRLPKGKNCHNIVRRPPVLIMHGLLVSSDCWIDSGPQAGLGYLIADGCYDLWLANVRGNYYSKEHINLNSEKDYEYWQFTLHEVGVYDLPAIIDFILHHTGSEKLNYIGYSQGGGVLFMMCSERSKYCKKVGASILLHPASKMKNTKSNIFRLIAKIYEILEPHVHEALDFEALPHGSFLQKTIAKLCQNDDVADSLCRALLNLIDSEHPGSIAASTIRTLAGHFPAGTSAKTLAWFSQILDADVLQKFDYGAVTNLRIYGKSKPPIYNISATNMPVVI